MKYTERAEISDYVLSIIRKDKNEEYLVKELIHKLVNNAKLEDLLKVFKVETIYNKEPIINLMKFDTMHYSNDEKQQIADNIFLRNEREKQKIRNNILRELKAREINRFEVTYDSDLFG